MAGGGIHFFSEDTSFQIRQKLLLRSWIRETVAEEGHLTSHLNFIFCSDEYLLRMNREYLNHDTYTDILTFDNSEVPGKISGDIFISIDRVKDNAARLGVETGHELDRVMIHGILHLLGFKDKTEAEKVVMRAKEDHYILKKRSRLA